jgi:acetyl esterase
MSLHPQAKAVLDLIAAQGGPPVEQMAPAEVRASRAAAAQAFAALAGPEEPVARLVDRTIPGRAQAIPVRVYWPETGRRLPVLVYFHGGGWVFGNLDQVDRVCRMIANRVPCIVVNVDYRLAPEHKFPAAADDAYAAARYVAEHAREFDADASRIAVGGDSAGGNLAAVACLMARDRGGPSFAFQLLIYPVTDYDDDRPSTYEYADGHLLTRAMMPYFWRHYVSSPEEARHPYASPLNAETLAGLPPAMVITAECDPIRDQGEAYARRLEQSAVAVQLQRYDGAIHAFFQMGGVIDAGKQAMADATVALRIAFSAEARATA